MSSVTKNSIHHPAAQVFKQGKMFKPRKQKGKKKSFFTARGLMGLRKDTTEDEATVESTSYRKSRKGSKPTKLALSSDSYSSSSSDDDMGSTPSDEGSHDDPTIFMASTDEDDLEDHLNVGCIDNLFFPGPREEKGSIFSFKRSEPEESMEQKVMPLALAYMTQLTTPRNNNLQLAMAQLNCKGPERKCTPAVGHTHIDVDEDVFEMDQEKLEAAMPPFFKSLMSLSDGESDDGDESAERDGLAFLATPPALYLTNGPPETPRNGGELKPILRTPTEYPPIETLPSQIVVQEQPSYGGDSILSFEMIPLGEMALHNESVSRAGSATPTVTAEQRQQYLAMNYGSALLSMDSDDSNPVCPLHSDSDGSGLFSEKENDGEGDIPAGPQVYSVSSPRKSIRDTLAPLTLMEGTQVALEKKQSDFEQRYESSRLGEKDDSAMNNRGRASNVTAMEKPIQNEVLSKLKHNQHEAAANSLIQNPWIGAVQDTFDFDDNMYPSFDEGPSKKNNEGPPRTLLMENGSNFVASSPLSVTTQPRVSPRAAAESPRSQNLESPRVLALREQSSPRFSGRESSLAGTPKSVQSQSMKSPRSPAFQIRSSPRNALHDSAATKRSLAVHSRLRGEKFDAAETSLEGTRGNTAPSSMYTLSHLRESPENCTSSNAQEEQNDPSLAGSNATPEANQTPKALTPSGDELSNRRPSQTDGMDELPEDELMPSSHKLSDQLASQTDGIDELPEDELMPSGDVVGDQPPSQSGGIDELPEDELMPSKAEASVPLPSQTDGVHELARDEVMSSKAEASDQLSFQAKGKDELPEDELMSRPVCPSTSSGMTHYLSSDEAESQSSDKGLEQSSLDGEKCSSSPETSKTNSGSTFWRNALQLNAVEPGVRPENKQTAQDAPETSPQQSKIETQNSLKGGKDPSSLEELLDVLSVANNTKAAIDLDCPSFDEQTVNTTATTATQFFEAKMA